MHNRSLTNKYPSTVEKCAKNSNFLG